MRIKTLMLAVSAIALGTVSPAAAEEPTTTTTQPTTCVSTCGQWGSIIGADIAGATFGEGLAGAIAEGGTTETGAMAEKTGTLNLRATIAGETDGCPQGCGDFAASLFGEGTENVRAAGYGIATGTDRASAGVVNSTQGGVSLLGRVMFGNMPAPASTGE